MSIIDNIKNNDKVTSKIRNLLHLCDLGELFVEDSGYLNITLEDGIVKVASKSNEFGYGLRTVLNDEMSYAIGTDYSSDSLTNVIDKAKSTLKGKSYTDINKPINNISFEKLYQSDIPWQGYDVNTLVEFLTNLDIWIRQQDSRIDKVNINLSAHHQKVAILREDSNWCDDYRPMVAIDISVVVFDKKLAKREQGFERVSKRAMLADILSFDNCKKIAKRAIDSAIASIYAVDAPSGEMTIILGSGWPGIILHEAIGHGLEADAIYKQTSMFHDKIGKKIAADGVTVIDQGNIAGKRGSLQMDDEATPSQKNVLINDGVFENIMSDRFYAEKLGLEPSGNGRRESYRDLPLPRMTNTFMAAGSDKEEDIIADTKQAIYAESFRGGQVDTTSGQFVFSCSSAWLIENGKKTKALKGASLIGNGVDTLKNIDAIGSETKLDRGVGICGKQGQSVPVCVGQPLIRVQKVVVGGQK